MERASLACGLAVVLTAVAGCGGDDDGGDADVAYPPTFEVDPSLEPARAEVSGLGGGDPRPIARVADELGHAVDFVENELVVMSDDASEVDAFVERWEGETVTTIDMSAVEEVADCHVVRIDPPAPDVEELRRDIHELDELARGGHRVSSETALGLIAVAVRERNGGLDVALDIVLEPHDIASRSTMEGTNGDATTDGTSFTSDAFDWPYMTEGSTQDIGVVEAWRTLGYHARLGAGVSIGIADGGCTDADHLPNDREVYPTASWGQENEWPCGGGSDCLWHCTHVGAAAFGVADDGRAAAGSAGPVARARFLQSPAQDVAAVAQHVIFAIDALGSERPRILNISAGGQVPATLTTLTNGPVDSMVTALRARGILTFASAGNDGDHVDAQDCARVCAPEIFGGRCAATCWETGTFTPCENHQTICVGGLAWDSTDAHGNSNWGTADDRSVDIYGPYEVWTGPDPDNTQTRAVTGTSFASPFVAGVAGLIMAGDPELGIGAVEDVLMDTAHTGGGDRVHRWVDAYTAVSSLFGDNGPPFVEIAEPTDGATLLGGEEHTLRADVYDPDGDDVDVEWESNVDGALGGGVERTVDGLSYGTHSITATAIDDDFETVSDTIEVEVENVEPMVDIVLPPGGDATLFEGERIRFQARTRDENEMGAGVATLADADVVWTSSVDGMIGTGHRIRTTLSRAAHVVQVVGTDDGGATDRDQMVVRVEVSPANEPPRDVEILRPSPSGGELPMFPVDIDTTCTSVRLQATATDPEGGTLTFGWTTDRDDLQDPGLGTGSDRMSDLCHDGSIGCSWHEVVLSVVDDAGHSRFDLQPVCIYAVEE